MSSTYKKKNSNQYKDANNHKRSSINQGYNKRNSTSNQNAGKLNNSKLAGMKQSEQPSTKYESQKEEIKKTQSHKNRNGQTKKNQNINPEISGNNAINQKHTHTVKETKNHNIIDKENSLFKGDYKKLKQNENEKVQGQTIPTNYKKEKELKNLEEKKNIHEKNYHEDLKKLNDINYELKLLNEKIQLEKKNYDELLKSNNELKKINMSLKEENQKYNDIKSKNSLIKSKEKNQINSSHIKYKQNYDIAIKITSLNNLLNGWDINYGNNSINKYLEMRNTLLIGLIGLKNKGKSFILSKLFKENDYQKEENDNLYLKYMTNNKNFKLAIIDTPGIGRSLKKNNERQKFDDEKYIKELEKYNIQTDNFLINFILKKCNFVICTVGFLDFNEQQLINKLKTKDKEYKKEFKELKKIFIIHNLKELSTKEEIQGYINNVLMNSLTFKVIEKDGNLAQNISNINCNTKYYIENINDKEMEIYHLIVAKENTEAGDYYNESTFTFLTHQYNSFHSYHKFDIIKELKEEIQLISKNLFTKPITSLDDFENAENIIKLKNKFEYSYNSGENENTDFSYLTLKPKYSYYKINNNTQLLVIIEMPGQIVDQKFVCSKKPKNGYYIMTFSGKKIVKLPENAEEQKKGGFFYTNIESGEFQENIKINIEYFQLISNKPSKKSEKDGIYEYYFDIMKDSGTISSDD